MDTPTTVEEPIIELSKLSLKAIERRLPPDYNGSKGLARRK